MAEGSVNQVVNCHWYGGSDKLPPNTVYIGRPSEHGNPYSSKSGLNTREECVALHRIDLYRSLKNDPVALGRLKHQLLGKDLACWCKQPKRIVGCHGDNFLHVLSERLITRDYTKSITFYLMDDLRFMLSQYETYITTGNLGEQFLNVYFSYWDTKVYIQYILPIIQNSFIDNEVLHFLLASLIVDLELGFQDPDIKMKEYRLHHAFWICNRFMTKRLDRDMEPQPPAVLNKPKKKGKVDA